jgi:hypothetical protein
MGTTRFSSLQRAWILPFERLSVGFGQVYAAVSAETDISHATEFALWREARE